MVFRGKGQQQMGPQRLNSANVGRLRVAAAIRAVATAAAAASVATTAAAAGTAALAVAATRTPTLSSDSFQRPRLGIIATLSIYLLYILSKDCI